MTECIHGFEQATCDICFPRQAPEPVVAAVTGSTRPPTRSPGPRPKKRVPGTSHPPVAGRPVAVPPFGSRRLYHVTHLKNLESILLDGEIRTRASGLEPDLDVVSPLVRELRDAAEVGDGRRVTEFVPFAISPDSQRWAELRDGAEGAQWSAEAKQTTATEYAVLVITGKDVGEDAVIASGDAAAPLTEFTPGDPGRTVAKLARTDPDLLAAEVLVPGPVPLTAIGLIAVANEPTRVRVRSMFADVEGAPPRVVVHPPWFVSVEA